MGGMGHTCSCAAWGMKRTQGCSLQEDVQRRTRMRRRWALALSFPLDPLRCHCGLSGVRDYGRCYAWVLEFWSMESRVLDARARNRPLRARNRGLWIPDTSTTPDSAQRSSGRPRTRSRKPRSDARLKFPLSQASSKPPDSLRKAAGNARGVPAFVHRPQFRAKLEGPLQRFVATPDVFACLKNAL